MTVFIRILLINILIVLSIPCFSQELKYPVIDMHLHVFSSDPRWTTHMPTPISNKPMTADNAQKHYEETMSEMKKWNYKKAMISGDTAAEWLWKGKNPTLFITGLMVKYPDLPDTVWLREAFKKGKIQVLGEVAVQYGGIAPDSSIMEPYYKLAEEYDIPVGIHIGPGPRGAAYRGEPRYRMRLSNPLLLEDVLIRHPKLRLYVMHAGWPMIEEMIGLMYAHPQVYVDLGIIDWNQPTAELHYYIKRLVDAGYGKRIMYGSDQMVWPDAITISLQNILSASFLSEEQKKDILYRNAMTFLKLKE